MTDRNYSTHAGIDAGSPQDKLNQLVAAATAQGLMRPIDIANMLRNTAADQERSQISAQENARTRLHDSLLAAITDAATVADLKPVLTRLIANISRLI